MIFAFGSTRLIIPMCLKLLGILSMKYGVCVRWMRVSSIYRSPRVSISRIAQLCQYCRIPWCVISTPAPVQRLSVRTHVVKLQRPLNLRMRCQYLLKQSRPGAGQSNDENGIWVAAPRALTTIEKLSIAEFFVQS